MATAIYIFLRLMPLLVVAPIFSLHKIPVFVRIIVCAGLSLLIVNNVPAVPSSNFELATGISEFVFGVSLAFGFHFALGAVHMGGAILEQQIGIASAVIFDPSAHHNSGLLSELLVLLVCFLMLTLNLHLDLIRYASATFSVVKPGSFQLHMVSEMLSGLGTIFFTGIALIIPTALVLWLLELVSAYISRALPQANIYFLMLPVKLFVGIVVLSISLRFITPRIVELYDVTLQNFEQGGL